MVLQKTQAETMMKFRSKQMNNQKNISIIEKQKITLAVKAYEDYIKLKSANHLIKYLLKVGNKYLRKPI